MTEQVPQQQTPPAAVVPPAASAEPVKPAVAAAAEAAATPAPLADPQLAALGEGYLKDGKPDFEKIGEALKRAHTDLPAEGKGYEIAFPKEFDLKGADGEVVKLDPADPIVGRFTEIAKTHGIGQAAVNDLVAVYGDIIKAAVGQNADEVKARQDQEFAKLDTDRTKAEGRALAASRGLAKALGDKAGPLIESMQTASHVEAIEAILEKINGTPTRSPPPNGKASKQSFAERLYG